MLELDHVICFVPARDALALDGFTIEPGRVHTGQGTRNVRVMFERDYLEALWIEHPAEVAARGLDFAARCARPATACPFGCVLRGTIGDAGRARFVAYPLPDAPGLVLQLLADQPAEAPFVAVFETAQPEAMWPARRGGGDITAYQQHASGARRIAQVTITAQARPAIDDLAALRFAIGAPALAIDFGGGVTRTW